MTLWNLGMLKTLVESQGNKFDDVEKVQIMILTLSPIENGLFDAAWIYHGWDGIWRDSEWTLISL